VYAKHAPQSLDSEADIIIIIINIIIITLSVCQVSPGLMEIWIDITYGANRDPLPEPSFSSLVSLVVAQTLMRSVGWVTLVSLH